jgi:hypothetical protein
VEGKATTEKGATPREGNGPGSNGEREDSPRLIEYDVSHLLPFPLERDPEIDGARPKRRSRRKRRELDPAHEQYRLYTVEELGEFPPVAWHIEGYLAAGELTVLYGRSDTYKSFVALDWSCELARRGLLVVYIVAEGASGIRARISAWMRHRGVRELPNLFVMPSNVNLHQPGAVETWLSAMREQLGDRHPDLVIADTLARNFVGGNESSPQDMGLFVEGVERIRRELLTAVVVIHHETKEGGTERGTESLRNASFAMFRCVRENQYTVDVKCDRMKDAEQPPARKIRPVRIELPELTEEGGPPVASLVAGWVFSPGDSPDSLNSDPGEIRANLSPGGARLLRALLRAKGRANPRELRRLAKMSSSSFDDQIKALLTGGFVAAEGRTRDRSYSLTEKGRAAL